MDLFPYKVRSEQRELIDFVYKNVYEKNLCIDATTGFGKTSCILAALLPHKKRIVWAVRTGNESDRPVEELKIINEKGGRRFFGLSYRGKKDMCLLAQNPDMDHESAKFFCRKKMGKCSYYKHLSDFSFSPEGPMLYSEIMRTASREGVCPYYLQRNLLKFATVVGLSYNYVLSDASLSLQSFFPFRESFLVVDEAHNLEQTFLNLNSTSITIRGVGRAVDELQRVEHTGKAHDFLQLLLKTMEEMEGESRIDADFFLGCLHEDGVHAELRGCGEHIREMELENGRIPRSSLSHVGEFFEGVVDKGGEKGVAVMADEGRVELYDMRTASLLGKRWKEFISCVFCSGTLAPIDGFAEIAGLENFDERTSVLPLSDRNVEGYIIDGISTRGESLSTTMVNRYVKAISVFLDTARKSAVFCSSYRIMDTLMKGGLDTVIEQKGIEPFVERRDMGGGDARSLLEEFRISRDGCLIANAQGRFSEGIDLPNGALEAVFIAGVPFERMTLKTRIRIDYFVGLYGKEKGMYYSYVVPAVRKTSQAMGRALRGSEDKATIFCGDERYARPDIFELLPLYFRENARLIGLP